MLHLVSLGHQEVLLFVLITYDGLIRNALFDESWDLFIRHIFTTSCNLSRQHAELTIALRIGDLRVRARLLHLDVLVGGL